ncbi:MAG TPA: tripartite tricarboxylate transporter substrate-binding protein [Vicinamibacterales bacterium]
MRRALQRGLIFFLLVASAAGCSGGGGRFPDRPIILICPWSAGGGTDRVARQLAVGLEQELGVPVNVVNATGASGVTGHTRGALARPDGYTITLMTAELNMLHWRGLTPITWRDFRPAALVNRDPAALFVRRDAPWKTLAELNAHVRAHPGTLRASGTALGGIWHLALVGWLTAIDAPSDAVRWISIEGAAPSMQELMAGGLEIVVTSLPEARSLLDAGEIRALGVMDTERVAQFPDVPTFAEQGVEAVIGTWRGVGVPAETPEAEAAVLVSALEKVVNSDEYRDFMRRSGFNWAYEGPEEFGATLDRLDGTFGRLLATDAFADLGSHIVGPMTFPSIIAGLGVVILGILLATGGLRTTAAADGFSARGAGRVALVLGAIGLYLVAAEPVGFVLTAGAITAFLMWLLDVRVRTALVVSASVVAVVYHVFAVLLRVPLPRGVLGW